MQSPLVNPIIALERPLETCCYTADDNDSVSYEINLPYYGGGSSEVWLVWKGTLLKALDGQSISAGPLGNIFTEKLSTGGAKATFN